MECKRCGNTDTKYFYKGSTGWYCRKCVKFKRILLDEEVKSYEYDVTKESGDYRFEYELTKFQKNASSKCLELIKNKDVLLKAVCGSGKTEITIETISNFLKQGLKVCYAISRKEVVIELHQRFSKIFSSSNVISVYGGHTKIKDSDLIICTTHQLFRYYKTFDLLILDEVDAFPLDGNETLMNIAINSCKGHIIFSTATISPFLNKYLKKRNYETVALNIRPSLKPLIVPKVFYLPSIFSYISLYFYFKRMNNQCIVFVPRKSECEILYRIYKHFYKVTYAYSELEDREKNIIDFKNKEYDFIFSTTVLERGITIKDVNVIVMFTHKSCFNENSLTQMTGRVGRNVLNPYGEAYIFTSFISKEIYKTVKHLKECNNELLAM